LNDEAVCELVSAPSKREAIELERAYRAARAPIG
jgi:hypothetical protein